MAMYHHDYCCKNKEVNFTLNERDSMVSRRMTVWILIVEGMDIQQQRTAEREEFVIEMDVMLCQPSHPRASSLDHETRPPYKGRQNNYDRRFTPLWRICGEGSAIPSSAV